MIRSRQILQGKSYDPVKVLLTDPGRHPPRHVQTTHRHCGQVVADHPRPLPVDGRRHREGHGVVGLRLRGERQHRDAPVQCRSLRDDQDRAALPELRELRILRQVAPVNLTDARGGLDAWRDPWRRCLVGHFLPPQGHQPLRFGGAASKAVACCFHASRSARRSAMVSCSSARSRSRSLSCISN